MEHLFDPVSLSRLFIHTIPLIETFLRGTIVYLALFFMLRFLAQRGSIAGIGTTDLLVIVLAITAVENAIQANYTSITDGLLLAAVVIM
jgi:uncharacterized membrane protein YcaP (DUF421 family)